MWPRPLRGAFAKRAKAGRTRRKGPEMRSYQTFPLVPVKRDTADPAGAAPAGVGFAGRHARAVPGLRPCGTRTAARGARWTGIGKTRLVPGSAVRSWKADAVRLHQKPRWERRKASASRQTRPAPKRDSAKAAPLGAPPPSLVSTARGQREKPRPQKQKRGAGAGPLGPEHFSEGE